LDLARLLVEELKEIGMQDVQMDSWGYVTATLPSNVEKDVPVMGLLAHMDTSAAASGADVKPRVVKNYDGGEIVLNEDLGILLSPADYPELGDYIGDDLVVTDGTTLLGQMIKPGLPRL
jgi:tripeptide aminopeptidase